MAGQKFYADPRHWFTWPNGAKGYRPGPPGSMDCLGPYAKVEKCPIEGTFITRTFYATGYADTVFSVPACFTIRGKRVTGYFTHRNSVGIDEDTDMDNIVFVPHSTEANRAALAPEYEAFVAARVVEKGL